VGADRRLPRPHHRGLGGGGGRRAGGVRDRRRTLAARYEALLGDLPQLTLPPGPDADADHFDVFQNYEIEAENRNELKTYLEAQGVRTIVQFGGKAVHQFSGLGISGVTLPFTERLYTRLLLLPMNTTLSDDDARYIVDRIRAFYGRKS